MRLNLTLAVLIVPTTALANTAKLDTAMKPLVAVYYKIAQTLTRDRVDGVAEQARQIRKLALKLDAKGIAGKHAAQYQALPRTIADSAAVLAKAKGLAPTRDAFKGLSRAVVLWASLSKPPQVHVVFCPMVKASWLQPDTKVRNPYHGSKMLACGEVIR